MTPEETTNDPTEETRRALVVAVNAEAARGLLEGGVKAGFKEAAEVGAKEAVEAGKTLAKEISPELRALSEAHLTDTGLTVLGRFSPPPGYLSYVEKAQQRGASYFDIGDVWKSLSPVEREAANLHFLDVVGARGDKVLLSVPKSEIIAGSALAVEVRYLQDALGYRWVNQWSLRPK